LNDDTISAIFGDMLGIMVYIIAMIITIFSPSLFISAMSAFFGSVYGYYPIKNIINISGDEAR